MADRIPVKAIYSGTYGSSDVTSLGELSSGETINGSYITDNSVTLAKMAHGTDGELITYDATGAPANVAVGTSGQVLTSGGAGVAPTFQTAASGGNVAGGSFSRNIATVGTLALTGFGFTPKAIHFSYGNQYSGLNVGFGWQWATNSYNAAITTPWTATGNWEIEPANGYPITFNSGSGSNGNRTDGRVTSFDADGVTITFSTPSGSPSGTMRVIYTAWG